MEVWSEDGMYPANVFADNTNHAESTGNAFTATLDETKAYTCLFWADDGTTFNVVQLKAVTLITDMDMTEAYFAKVDVQKMRNTNVSVILKRAVAKIVLIETDVVKTTDTMKLTFTDICSTFSVLEGAATGSATSWTTTITPTASTATFASLYLFAKPMSQLTNLAFTYASELEKNVSNIPYQQNFATNIKGAYSSFKSFSFSVKATNDWGTPDIEEKFPKKVNVGDFYYDDDTFSSTYDTTKTCIGIVFLVNNDYKTGKIVGLTEATELKWSPVYAVTLATDASNGRANMAVIATKIAGEGATWESHPAFTWVTELNGKPTGGWADTDKWYLPAKEELATLYSVWNVNRDGFNTRLTTGGGTKLSDTSRYWSSTENTINNAWTVHFKTGTPSSNTKSYIVVKTRSIRVF